MTSEAELHGFVMSATNAVLSIYQLLITTVMRPFLLSSLTVGWHQTVAVGLKLWLQDIAPDESCDQASEI